MDATTEALAKAMTTVEMCVQDLAEAGLTPMQIAVGLAFHMNRQAELAIPYPAQCLMWKTALIA